MAESGSFIPKQQPRPTQKVRRRRVYVVSYVVTTFFLCVVISAAGLVAWGWQLENQLADRQAELNELRAQFSTSDLLRVKEVEARLDTVATLLDTQPATSKLFAALNAATLENIQLENFSITAGNQPDILIVEYVGITDTYDAVLAQRRALEAAPLLAEAEVLSVSYDSQGATIESFAETADEPEVEEETFERPVQFSVSLELPMDSIAFSGELPTADSALLEATEGATSSAPETGGDQPATPPTESPADPVSTEGGSNEMLTDEPANS